MRAARAFPCHTFARGDTATLAHPALLLVSSPPITVCRRVYLDHAALSVQDTVAPAFQTAAGPPLPLPPWLPSSTFCKQCAPSICLDCPS